MKKNILVLVAGMIVSAASHAAAGGGQLVSTDTNKGVVPVRTDNCELLGEDIRITLSKDVAGGYYCDEGNTNQIAVTMCHPNGKKTNATNNNFYTMNSSGGKIDVENDAPCGATAAATKAKTSAETEPAS